MADLSMLAKVDEVIYFILSNDNQYTEWKEVREDFTAIEAQASAWESSVFKEAFSIANM